MALYQGSTGAAVSQLQQQLVYWQMVYAVGSTLLVVDGNYGPKTAGVVAQFQSSKGLPATGTYDDATAAQLQAWLTSVGMVAPTATRPRTVGTTPASDGGTPPPPEKKDGFLEWLGWNKLTENEKSTVKLAGVALAILLVMPRD